MQLAHPAVATAVDEHSDFPRRPYERLWRTLESMLTITFGDTQQSAAAAERVNAVHRGVVGDTYRATDPDLLLWVHATLVDSALVVYERFVGPLTPAERAGFWEESKVTARLLGVPDARLPRTLDDFRRWFADVLA